MTPTTDRTPHRLALDEVIAGEPPAPPDLPAGATPAPVEAYLRRGRKPVAVAGVVEGGVVRLLDPAGRLPERSRVIVVAPDPTTT